MNGEQEMLLKELSHNPVWASILRELEPAPLRPWVPKDQNEQAKLHRWIYQSGTIAGVQNVLKALGYRHD